MLRFSGDRVDVSLLDSHVRICDLLELEVPLLCLYSDGRRNWLYLWCDTDGVDTHRWLLFEATREQLVAYLERRRPLLDVLRDARKRFILDEVSPHSDSEGKPYRQLRHVVRLSELSGYLPHPDALFDEELAPDIETARGLVPHTFSVPINSTWFAVDFNDFFKSYSRIYAFFYATRPRFVKSIEARLGELLRAPWKGGYSRINLFATLPKVVPALHGLRVPQLHFASPGHINFEALTSVGDSIRSSVIQFTKNGSEVEAAVKSIKVVLSSHKLNKLDLSEQDDHGLSLGEDKIAALNERCFAIADLLGMREEIQSLRACSPNSVVFSKAVAGLVTQLRRLAQFQQEGMLDLERNMESVSS